MAPDLILFLVIVGLFFVVGLPLITRRVWMPVQLEIEDVAESELTDGQRLYFDDIDRSLGPLGLGSARTYRVANLQGFNLVRSYLSEVDPEMVHAMLLRAEASFNQTPTALNYLEVMTRYADGTGASTRNGDVSSVFAEPPHLDIAVRRTVHSPADLVAAHRQRTSTYKIREPLFAKAEDLVPLLQEHHERWSRFQVEHGALRTDPEAGLLHPTVKTGLRGISNFLNPFADNFTVARMIGALLLGLAIPVAGTFAFANPTSPAITWLAGHVPIDPIILSWGALGAVFALLGLVTGLLFGSKSFLWTFILAWIPLRLLGPALVPAFVLSLWAGGVAGVVCTRRMRRKALV